MSADMRALIEATIPPDITLYHGTSRELADKIVADGLHPTVGAFTHAIYTEYAEEGEALQDLVFAADRKGLNKCYSAMIRSIEAGGAGVMRSAEAIAEYGALLVIKGHAESFQYRVRDDEHEDDWGVEHPPHVEPGDYYSEDHIEITHMLTGKRLVQFLIRNGVVLHDDSPKSVNVMRGRLAQKMIRSGVPKDEAVSKVAAMPAYMLWGELRD